MVAYNHRSEETDYKNKEGRIRYMANNHEHEGITPP